MAKELVYILNSDSELEALIDRLEKQVDIRKASLDEGLGFSLRNNDRSLEIHILPQEAGENYQVIAKAYNKRLENTLKQIFGKPIKEMSKDASILDVAEYIVELPNNYTKDEILALVKKEFSLDENKLQFFKKMIIKQATKEKPREYIINAASKLK